MYNFAQINNNYIDEENTQSFEQMNKYNFLKEIYDNENNNNNNNKFYRNNSINISKNNLSNNISHNINNSTFNRYESCNIINNGIYNFNINNSEIMQDQNNNNNNIYYPTINIDSSNNYNNSLYNPIINNINNNYSNALYNPIVNNGINNNINNNCQELGFCIPPFNNNNQYENNKNDLSFLGGYTKTNNLKEDYLKLNTSNPEIFTDLKEKIYYYHSLYNGFNLVKINCKGYIGINIKQPNIINNKTFYINILSEKLENNNYFIDRNMNKKLNK